jgi:hypothetical protein
MAQQFGSEDYGRARGEPYPGSREATSGGYGHDPYEQGRQFALGEHGGGYPYEQRQFGFGEYGRDDPYERGRPFGEYGRQEYGRGQDFHEWRGGVLGWFGSGVRAAAGWVGNQLQFWGRRLGGRLSGRGAQLGEALRGRGERIGSQLEQGGEEAIRRAQQFGEEVRRMRKPHGYRRPDDRILDDLWERILRSPVDAENVEIQVKDGVVTLSGKVRSRADKRFLEDLAEALFGVDEVHNQLAVGTLEKPRPEAELQGGYSGMRTGNGHHSSESESRSRP